jgi:hypothetical protein
MTNYMALLVVMIPSLPILFIVLFFIGKYLDKIDKSDAFATWVFWSWIFYMIFLTVVSEILATHHS